MALRFSILLCRYQKRGQNAFRKVVLSGGQPAHSSQAHPNYRPRTPKNIGGTSITAKLEIRLHSSKIFWRNKKLHLNHYSQF
jgi:hypothetical protein